MTKKTARQAALTQQTANLISTTEAARVSGFTTAYIRQLLISGKLEGVKVGRNWLTTEEALREYLKQERHPGPKPRQKG